MALRFRYTFYIDPDQHAALRAIQEQDGVPVSEQIRRAVQEWIATRGPKKSERKRAVTRKRS